METELDLAEVAEDVNAETIVKVIGLTIAGAAIGYAIGWTGSRLYDKVDTFRSNRRIKKFIKQNQNFDPEG